MSAISTLTSGVDPEMPRQRVHKKRVYMSSNSAVSDPYACQGFTGRTNARHVHAYMCQRRVLACISQVQLGPVHATVSCETCVFWV